MRPTRTTVLAGLIVICACIGGATSRMSDRAPLGDVFTYQGLLRADGAPVDGTADFQFSLWDAPTGGSQVAPPVNALDETVTDGAFTVDLDFGDVFATNARWLEITARTPAGSGDYTPLTPRQPVRPAPASLWAKKAGGLTLPCQETVTSNSAPALEIRQMGLEEAGRFEIMNQSSNRPALVAYTSGTGSALSAEHTGATGEAGYFHAADFNGAGDAIHAQTEGSGRAGYFINNDLDNTSPVIEATTANTEAVAIKAVNSNATGTAIESGGKIVSTVADGNPPFEIDSTTLVENLNADMVDGTHLTKLFYDVSNFDRGVIAEAQQYTDSTQITFSTPFSYYPVVVATAQQPGVIATIQSWTATGFELKLRNHDGTTYSGSTYVHWIAIGKR